ncbi:hypothetical protein K3977_03055 [Weissella viridescens]|uniref:hypothetical protein n=1 Tax=Weissella viridescens TaxID=1629 RepID=UPI001C7D6149|nr:hypothetical protein [Weissella viridescens]MBX4172602.1 hypothetical protein [Weissella viridescens]
MIPNNLEEVDALLNMKIYQAGIQLFEDEWESDDPDVAVRTNDDEYVIIMNKNFSTSFTPVHRKAHEFSHLLFSDMQHGEAYHFSPYLRNKDEVVANHGAIKILTEIIYHEMTLEERDWMKFIDIMNLPLEYESIVQECVRTA